MNVVRNRLQLTVAICGFFGFVVAVFSGSQEASATTIGVGACYIVPNCEGSEIGLMPFDICVDAGGGAGSWNNQDGSGCYNTH